MKSEDANPGPWPKHFRTLDGNDYWVRPITVDDLDRDRRFLKGLSETSRYNRMMGLMPDPPQALLEDFVHVDYAHTMALVAVVGHPADETIIGVARYNGTQNDCEFAIAIADDWQSHGVGTTLARLLFEYAKARGIRRLHAIFFTRNNQMLGLAHELHMSIRRSESDNAVLEASQSL
jgi:acetyltransferase